MMPSHKTTGMRLICTMISWIALGGTLGCGRESPKKVVLPQEKDPISLAQSDLRGLNFLDEVAIKEYDRSSNHRFSQIFGGYSGRHVRNFIDERIKFLLQERDIVDLNPRASIHAGWTQLPPVPEGSIVASNIGTHFWMQGLLDDTVFTITLTDGQNIQTTSSRVGIMLFGSGYTRDLETSNSSIELPATFRQATLIHEARHSDCSGGITRDDINKARQAKSYVEFIASTQAKKCGHLHSLCTDGVYKDLPACDAGTWGSYGIEVIFLEAVLRSVPTGTTQWQVLNALTVDAKSRLQFNYTEMIHSPSDHPDLTSSGLRE